METAAHPRILLKPRTFGKIFVTFSSSASLRTGVVKTFRCANEAIPMVRTLFLVAGLQLFGSMVVANDDVTKLLDKLVEVTEPGFGYLVVTHIYCVRSRSQVSFRQVAFVVFGSRAMLFPSPVPRLLYEQENRPFWRAREKRSKP